MSNLLICQSFPTFFLKNFETINLPEFYHSIILCYNYGMIKLWQIDRFKVYQEKCWKTLANLSLTFSYFNKPGIGWVKHLAKFIPMFLPQEFYTNHYITIMFKATVTWIQKSRPES